MEEDDGKTEENKNVVLHVAVVGFHHKKGTILGFWLRTYQRFLSFRKREVEFLVLNQILEYSYPPLTAGNSHNSSSLPPEWSCLPALALPDGAHHHRQEQD